MSPTSAPSPPAPVTVTRDGVVESVHTARVVVATPDGRITPVAGDPDERLYPRSAFKPFQAIAIAEQLHDLGHDLDAEQLAIVAASHDGTDDAQVAAASVLAEADLDEAALRCPADWPLADVVTAQLDGPTTLSHNCSGKHAGLLWAHTAAGHPAATYLDLTTALQQRVARQLADVLGAAPTGPGVDGCGAPAWVTTPARLAVGFAKLADGATPLLARVRQAMCTHPELIGGATLPDTALMLADARVVAKRGADGVMAAGVTHERYGSLGVVVKVVDGADRASGPATAAVLEALGCLVPPRVRRPPVLGGGAPHGEIVAAPSLPRRITEVFGLA